MKTIALINNKGGVGKTTVAINLSAYLTSKGKKILLIDLDSQGSAGLSLGFGRNPEGITMTEILFDKAPVSKGIRKTNVENLDIILSREEIADFDQVYKKDLNIVKRTMDKINGKYDYIFIDCPPALSLLAKNALVTADKLIIPITLDYLAIEGLTLLTKDVLAPRSPYMILFNQVDNRLKVTEEIIDFVKKQHKDKVFITTIKRNVRIKEAPSFHKTIFDYDKHSSGAECFKELGKEFLKW
ncbi:Sporulation initiation inhibitor protein Soj [subsurface metagenome]